MLFSKPELKVLALVFLSAFLCSRAASAGQLNQDFAVTSQGAASYKVDIQVPPGTANVQPELSLSYNHQSSVGLMGKGWNLSGLSYISRCAQNLAQDNAIREVKFDSQDRFCLQGERLLAVSGSYGAEGTVYHTEKQSWTRVISKGNCGGSPCSFIASNKSGLTMEFGVTPNSSISYAGMGEKVYIWALNKVSDRNGNFWQVEYHRSDATFYPKNIRYTGNDRTGLAPIREIAFNYQNSSTPIETWKSGVRQLSQALMSSIHISVEGKLVRRYELVYENSSNSGRELLKQIQECSAAGECLPLADLRYNNPPKGFKTATSFNVPGNAFHVEYDGWQVKSEGLFRDINGDGIVDFSPAYCEGSNCKNKVFLGSAGGFSEANFSLPGNVFDNEVSTEAGKDVWGSKAEGTLQDINGDGIIDYSRATCWKGSNCELEVFHGTGNGFVRAGYLLPGPLFLSERGKFVSQSVGILQDLNGDGFPDYSAATCNDKNECNKAVYHGTGNGFYPAGYSLPGPIFYNQKDGWLSRTEGLVNDFNGDGLADYTRGVCYDKPEKACELTIYHGTGHGFEAANYGLPMPIFKIAVDGMQSKSMGVLHDFNGDGIPDFSPATCSRSDAGLNCDFRVFHGTGRGFVPANYGLPGKIFASKADGWEFKIEGALQDINGDGLVDYTPGTCFSSKGSDVEQCHLQVSLGTGSGFKDAGYGIPGKIFHNHDSEWNFRTEGVLQDFNGDGVADFSRAICWYSFLCLKGVYLNQNVQADVLISIKNRLSGSIAISYEAMTNPDVYTKGSAGQQPGIDVQLPILLVKSYQLSDGRGSTYNLSYRYQEARVDPRGRGWLGFRKVTELNQEAKLITTRTYQQTFPLIGALERSELKDMQGRILKVSRSHYQSRQSPENSGVYRVELVRQRDDIYFDGDYDSTQGKNFEYDDYGNIRVTYNFGDINDPTDNLVECSVYAYDLDRWLLSFPSIKKVSKGVESCQPGQIESFNSSADYRLSRYSWDDNYNLTTDAEYLDTIQSFVPKTFAYDEYGNRIRTTLALGSTVDITYDEKTHTFPIQTLSPAQSSGRALVERSQYSLAFGTLTSQIDANGNLFQYEYDGFGRIVSRSGPGPSGEPTILERWNYSYCADGQNCSPGMMIQSYTRPDWEAADSSLWPWQRTYYDGLGRQYLTQNQAGDAGEKIVEVQTQFDAQGRIKRESLPYFTGDEIPWKTNSYDIHNRPLVVTNPLGASQRSCYAMGNDSFSVGDVCPTVPNSGAQPAYDFDEQANIIEGSLDKPSPLSLGNRQNLTTAADPRLRDDADTQIFKSLNRVNSQGRLIKQQAIDGSEVNYTYNRLGQVLTSLDPSGASTKYSYDSLGNLIKTDDNSRGVSHYRYDRQGRLMESTDSSGTVTKFSYDQLDRIVMKELIGSGARAGESMLVKYGYDDPKFKNSNGRLAWTAWREYDPDNKTWINYRKAFAYDPYGRMIISQFTIESPDRKLHYLGNSKLQSFVAMKVLLPTGQVKEHIYPDGSKATYSYNQSLQMTAVEFQESDADGNPGPKKLIASFSDHNALGQIQNIKYGNGVESQRAYDQLGRMLRSATVLTDGSVADDVNYAWNKANKLYAIEDGRAATDSQTFSYDERGRMRQAEGVYGTKTYSYDPSGNPIQLGDFKYEYSPTRKHQIQRVRDAQGKLLGEFAYDLNGNMIMQPFMQDYGKRPLRKRFYSYDLNNRLKEVRFGNSQQGSKISNTFTYDPFGQRVKKTSLEGRVTLYVFADYEITVVNPGHQVHTKNISGSEGILAALTEDYSTDLNIQALDTTSRSVLSSAFDVSSLEGFLSWLAQLLQQFGTKLMTLLPRILLASVSACMLLAAFFLVRDRRPIRAWARVRLHRALIGYPMALVIALSGQPMAAMAALDAGPSGHGYKAGIRYLHQNHQMSTSVVTGEAGTQIARVAYEPFGRIVDKASTGEDSFRQKYTGKEFDEDSGLYFMGSRYYDPILGRFLSPDPAWQYHSPYVYGANDPLAGRDPNGEFFWFIFIGIAIGAVAGGYFGGVAANGGNFNPAQWDWTSGKTWAGILVGAFIGGVSGGVGAGLASSGAGIGAVMLAEGVLGAIDGLAMGGINGKSGIELFTDGLLGFAGGAAFGGVLHGLGKVRLPKFGSGSAPDAPASIMDDMQALSSMGLTARKHLGSDPNKIAIMGRSMGGDGKNIGVKDAAQRLKMNGKDPFVFEPSDSAWQQFMRRVGEYRAEVGNPDAMLPAHLVRTTNVYEENENWVRILIKDGYTVYDIGNPNNLADPSPFYNMEKANLFLDF